MKPVQDSVIKAAIATLHCFSILENRFVAGTVTIMSSVQVPE